MSHSKIESFVDDIAQAMVFIDWSDPGTWDDLPERFGDLAAMLREAGLEEEATHCGKAAAIAGELLGGGGDGEAGRDFLNRTLNALQACVSGDCSCTEAGWPVAGPTAVVGSPAPPTAAATPANKSTQAAQPAQPSKPVQAAKPAPAGKAAAAKAPAIENLLVDEGIMAEFLSRQADILDDVEKELLSIEAGDSAGDREGINRFFHTLKGESSLLGLNDVADLCHAVEDMMQSRELSSCIDQLLEVRDWFIATFRSLQGEGSQPAPVAEMMARLKGVAVEASEPAPEPVADAAPPVAPVAAPAAAAPRAPRPEAVAPTLAPYTVVDYSRVNVLEGDLDLVQDFVEEAVEHLDASEAHLLVIEVDPKEKEALNAVFRGFHTIKGLAGFIEMEHIKDLAHKAENLLDMARRGELELIGRNMDLVFESVDMMKRLIEGVATAMGSDGALAHESALPSLMARLVQATSGEPEAAAAPPPPAVPEPEPEPEPVVAPAAGQAKSGFIPLGNMKKKPAAAAAAASPAPPAPAAAPAAPAPAPAPTPVAVSQSGDDGDDDRPQAATKTNAPTKMKEAMRVDAERLDHLIETIGELVIAESMVSQSPEIQSTVKSVKLAKDLDHLDKICRELQEIGMSLRMVPVRPVFQKMARLVRDLSKKQNRVVDFVMSGEDTELDKNVVDKIGDPLVHMVRNSVDHGIEADPADRVKLGKSERGRVELRAFHKGGNICIEIEDDGRGLNREAITAKAISRGMLREGEPISDRDLFNLIFEPGFSTAKEVTDISGRGVGMDVVRRNIEELRGTVEIASEAGRGSTFSIKLPLTLAIIEGMVIKVGLEHYIIPTLSVVRLIRPDINDVSHVFDRGEMLAFEGSHLPLFRLSRLFDVEHALSEPHEAMVVVVEDEGRKIGLMADKLLGQQSIVIKSLGETVQGTDGVAGGAIMADGNVALILDIAGLVRVAHAVDTTVDRRATAQARLAAASIDNLVAEVVSGDFAVKESDLETVPSEASPAGVDV